MKRPHTPDRFDDVLAEVVRGFHVPSRQLAVLQALLTRGPYRVPAVLVTELESGVFRSSAVASICAELAAFLSAVASRSALTTFGTIAPIAFTVEASGAEGQVEISVGTNAADGRHNLRDLAFVQLTTLVQLAGIRRVQVCQAPILIRALTGERTYLPCGRLFVKTGKQKYCGRGCQKRVAMQQKRRRDRAEAERRAERRRKRRV